MNKRWSVCLIIGLWAAPAPGADQNPCRECRRPSDICWRLVNSNCIALEPPRVHAFYGQRELISTTPYFADACDSPDRECLTLTDSYTTGYDFCVGAKVGAEFGLVMCPGGPTFKAEASSEYCHSGRSTQQWQAPCCAAPGTIKTCEILKYERPVVLEITTSYFMSETWEWRDGPLCEGPPAQRRHCTITFCNETIDYESDRSQLMGLRTEVECCDDPSGIREDGSGPGNHCGES